MKFFFIGRDADGFFNRSHKYLAVAWMASAGRFQNGVNGDIVGTAASPIDPQLEALANNGGSTSTHALRVSSPALNTGEPSFSALSTDQRGLPRVVNGRLDIGAFEFQSNVNGLSINDVTVDEDAGV